jgi:alpha-L-fucosidase
MNVGPTARGTFDQRAIDALDVYGDWLKLHARAIYGAGRSTYTAPDGCRFTQRGNRLYLHIYNWPFRHIHLAGLAGKVRYAQFLHDASELHWLEPTSGVQTTIEVPVAPGTLTLELPVRQPNVVVPVVELVLKDA